MIDAISTYSGQKINLNAESNDDLIIEIKLEDIARGLSRINRFNGQTTEPYSVAQHSIIVASLVPERLKLAALLHDAAEYATGDLVSPFKAMLPAMKQIERRIEDAIYAKFGVVINDYDKKIIKAADLVALATEKRDLMPHSVEAWEIIRGVIPLDTVIEPWDHKTAFSEFLSACKAHNLHLS